MDFPYAQESQKMIEDRSEDQIGAILVFRKSNAYCAVSGQRSDLWGRRKVQSAHARVTSIHLPSQASRSSAQTVDAQNPAKQLPVHLDLK